MQFTEVSGSDLGARNGDERLEAFINSKFVMDGAFHGSFATLDDFYAGAEKRIGAPNPNIREGMENEHCKRSNADEPFETSNYNFKTCPRLEWEFVVDPKSDVCYPHTPKSKALWRYGAEWKGDHGRDIIHLEDLMKNPEVSEAKERAGMEDVEIISIRLYTGPLFVLVSS